MKKNKSIPVFEKKDFVETETPFNEDEKINQYKIIISKLSNFIFKNRPFIEYGKKHYKYGTMFPDAENLFYEKRMKKFTDALEEIKKKEEYSDIVNSENFDTVECKAAFKKYRVKRNEFHKQIISEVKKVRKEKNIIQSEKALDEVISQNIDYIHIIKGSYEYDILLKKIKSKK